MKVIVQIPCLNEEETLPATLAELPRQIPGVDTVEWLVIDDGSVDQTVDVAFRHGVDYVVRHNRNKGLAAAFQTGLDACLMAGADIIVNTDADNQYPGRYIDALVAPILSGHADIVIGDRQVDKIADFSGLKKLLQKLGSQVVKIVSQSDVPDAPSGFRALSREAALRINVLTGFTYTLETIIQGRKKNLTFEHIPVETNLKTRESRLIKSTTSYVFRSTVTILRLFLLYEPLRTFSYLSLPFLAFGVTLWLRFLVLLIQGETSRGSNVQSIIVGSVAILIAFIVFVIGLLGDVVAINRRLQEEAIYLLKREAFAAGKPQPLFHTLTRADYLKRQPQSPEVTKDVQGDRYAVKDVR